MQLEALLSLAHNVSVSEVSVKGIDYVCVHCSPWPVPAHEIVDTTGAGVRKSVACLHYLLTRATFKEALTQ
jgi:sugar/nucleoside kinase (ribokinase family)